MKSIVVVAYVLIFGFLSGCASVSREYSATDQKFLDLRSAQQGVRSLATLEFAKAKNIDIGEKSPAIDFDTVKGKFEIVSVQGEKGQPFSISVAAICDCLGFRKWSVVPIAYLLDPEGLVVAQGTSSLPGLQMINGTFPRTDTYTLIVVADKTSQGKKLGDIVTNIRLSGPTSNVIPIFLSLKSHPTGVVQIKFPAEELK